MPFGSNYTVNWDMHEVIVDTLELTRTKGVIFGGRQRAFVVAPFTPSSGGLVCCYIFTAKKQMSKTNRSMPDEVCMYPCILSVNLP